MDLLNKTYVVLTKKDTLYFSAHAVSVDKSVLWFKCGHKQTNIE